MFFDTDRWVLQDSQGRLVCVAAEFKHDYKENDAVMKAKPDGSARLMSAIREDGRCLLFWVKHEGSKVADTVTMLKVIRGVLELPDERWASLDGAEEKTSEKGGSDDG